MAKPKPRAAKGAFVRVRVTPELRDQLARAAEMIGVETSTFLRMAGIEKLEAMRAAGKKI
jgi:antitoxin component of RelBE/YafQ-DinJ toxin-antitoxin module